MKRVLIIGASGFIGSNLTLALRDTFRVFGTYCRFKPRIDRVPFLRFPLTPEAPLTALFDRLSPQAVVYCAGLSDVDPCRQDPLGALFLNAELPAQMASLMQQRKGQFLYLSSPKVFPGDHGGYKEDHAVSPQTIYGKTKVRAEELMKAYAGVSILRLGTVFGFGSFRRRSFLNEVLLNLREGREMKLISDEYRSFYGIENVVTAIRMILGLDASFSGLFHLGHHRRDSYYTFAKTVAEVFHLPPEPLIPVLGATVASPEPRGRDTTIHGEAFARRFGWQVPPMEESLELMKAQLASGLQ